MGNIINPVVGGLLIGLSAVLLMYFLGRIAGISGIFWQATQPRGLFQIFSKERLWAWLFILGLPAGAWIAKYFLGISPDVPSGNLGLIIVAGLLVGIGTRMGGGCTSGHGVCGISRFSVRSIVATLVFMGAGIVTVAMFNYVSGRGM